MLKDALLRMADVFSPAALLNGQEYQQKGYVLTIRLSDGLLKARVKGRSSQIYDVHIDLKSWPTTPAHCSCQYRINCEHAAASLFSLQVRENYDIPAPQNYHREESLGTWLASLREKEEKKVKKDNTHELVYLIELQLTEYEHRVLIKLALAKRRKRGGLGKKIFFNTVTDSRRQYFTDEDEHIVTLLIERNNSRGWFERFALRNSELLKEILNTGRAYLSQHVESKLQLGEPVNAKLVWRLTPNGNQTAILENEDDAEAILPVFLDKPWYFDEALNTLGLLAMPYPVGTIKKVLKAPPVGLENVSNIIQQMTVMCPDLPPPKIFEKKETYHIEPSILIRFDAIELKKRFLMPTEIPHFLFVADIFFNYDGVKVKIEDAPKKLVKDAGKKLIEIPRNIPLEKKIHAEITQVLALRSPNLGEKIECEYDISHEKVLANLHNEDDLAKLYKNILPLFEKRDWKVEFTHPVYQEIIDADEVEWFSEVEERGNDFFSYQLGILIDGKQVSIVPLVAELIARLDKNKIDNLPDHTVVKMPLPEGKTLQVTLGRVKPLIRFLLQYGTRHLKDETRLRISRYQLILMRETEQAMLAISARWLGAETIRRQLNQLTSLTSLPNIEVPSGLETSLRDYQQEGLNWLQFLRLSQFGGCWQMTWA
ncbi:hypothetical protein clem_09610 [Legionella clemsonensis]|uniref:SWIM-type domain-containing protein n=1 Tax=Legionella clemsonensis TaxID=1867846 RepID=A0A222P3R5_9GAMM|nr:SWIM zinc finger family protein [Legionella clemsonensis]ASQ46472.1 hypothetical protein clem_09610 [Legionella clemsonensis]